MPVLGWNLYTKCLRAILVFFTFFHECLSLYHNVKKITPVHKNGILTYHKLHTSIYTGLNESSYTVNTTLKVKWSDMCCISDKESKGLWWLKQGPTVTVMEVLIQLNAVLIRNQLGNAHMGMLLTGRVLSVLVHLQ